MFRNCDTTLQVFGSALVMQQHSVIFLICVKIPTADSGRILDLLSDH